MKLISDCISQENLNSRINVNTSLFAKKITTVISEIELYIILMIKTEKSLLNEYLCNNTAVYQSNKFTFVYSLNNIY